MTRELKLALIVGFALVLTVTVLISDHFSQARQAQLATVSQDAKIAAKTPEAPIRSYDDLLSKPLPPAVQSTTVSLDPANPGTSAGPSAGPSTGPSGGTDLGEAAPTPPPPSRDEPIEIRNGRDASQLTQNDPDRALRDQARRLGGDLSADGELSVNPGTPAGRSQPTSPVKPETPKPVPGKTHVVAAGDNLYQLAQRYYGNGSLWPTIADANRDALGSDNTVRVGMNLLIPDRQPAAAKDPVSGPARTDVARSTPAKTDNKKTTKADSKPEPKADPKPETKNATYTVKKGDTIGVIAQRTLGSSKRAAEILKLNNIKDADSLAAGAVLKIPAR